MKTFLNELSVQRWDDHRLYHHSRINQTLHLVSALGFLVAYAMVPFDPAWAALLAWCLSMVSRQVGHFFFEPRGFDQVNMVSDEYKEAIKVGYNIRRKIVLMGLWAASPLLLWLQPGLWGVFAPAATPPAIVQRLNQEIARFLHTAEAREKFLAVGVESVGSTPEVFAKFIQAEISKWARVVALSGARAE